MSDNQEYIEEQLHIRRRRRRRRSARQRLGDWFQARIYIFLILILIGLAIVFVLNPFGLVPVTAWMVAGGIGVTAVGLSFWRLRERINQHAPWWDRACPQCDGPNLKRIHRKPHERLATAVGIPLRRYVCTDCHWRGARIDETRI